MADLAQAWSNIETHLRNFADDVRAKIEEDAPVVAGFVSQTAANPVFTALSAAVHLNDAPEMLASLADWIVKADAALGAAKAAGAAEAQAAAQQPEEPAQM